MNSNINFVLLILTIVVIVVIIGIYFYYCIKYCKRYKSIVNDGKQFSLEQNSSTGFGRLYQTYLSSLKGQNITTDFASDVVNADVVADVYKMNLHVLNIIPNILTGLGILGTFLGLSVAVLNFDSSSSETIRSSIKILLSGMGTAFITSVFGMTCSMLFLRHIKGWLSKIDTSINQVCAVIDEHHHVSMSKYIENAFCVKRDDELVTPSMMLINIEKEIKGVKTGLDTFTTDLYDSIGNALDDNFQQKIVPILNDLAVKLENPAQALTDGLILQFKDLCDNFGDKLTSNVNDQMNELLERFIDASNAINTIPETLFALSEQMSGIYKETVESSSNLMNAINYQTTKLNEASGVFTDTIEQMNQTLEEITTLHDKLKALPESITDASDAIIVSSTELNETNGLTQDSIRSLQTVNTSLSDQITQYLSDVKTIQSGIQEIFKQVEDGLTQYSEATKKSIQSMMVPFANSVTEATENVANAIAPLNDTLDGLNDFKQNVNLSLTQLNGTLAPLSVSLEKLLQLKSVMEKLATLNPVEHEEEK